MTTRLKHFQNLNSMKPVLLVTFHRHGMRAPVSGQSEERHKWIQELPPPATLNSFPYPIQVAPNNPVAWDVQSYPFGCLTLLGLHHMQATGTKFKKHFSAVFGTQSTISDKDECPSIQVSSSSSSITTSSVTSHSAKTMNNISEHRPYTIKVCSTNYQRTQASTQAFLSGLDVLPGTLIEVRDYKTCSMSFYHGKKDLSKSMTRRLSSSPVFLQLEQEVAPVAGLVREALALDEVDDLNWITIADSINCQIAHGHDIHPALETHATVLRENAVQRFVAHYKDKEYLAHFAGPLLQDVIDEIDEAVAALLESVSASSPLSLPPPPYPPPRVTVFSGHDINILGMLFAMNALIDDSHWPSYGSTLSFEVVEVNDPVNKEGVNRSDREGLLNRLRINFHYGSGLVDEPIAPLPLCLHKEVFDKRAAGVHKSKEDVAATLIRDDNDQTVVASVSYAEFIAMKNDIFEINT